MLFRKTVPAVALTSALLVAFGSEAQAPSQNLEKLKQMKVATTGPQHPGGTADLARMRRHP
jgi:hypothetical protein